MKSFYNSGILEKVFSYLFLIIFLLFAIFYSISNLKEENSKYDKEKILFTKNIAKDVFTLLENQDDVSSKLSNIVADNSVIYAILQLSDGSIVAKSESYALPVGIFDEAEAKALNTDFLIISSFKDSSERFSIQETAIPIFTREQSKYILRLGFLKNREDEKISNIKIRNILVFSLIFIFLLSLKYINYYSFFNLRYSLISSMTLVMVSLFFLSSFFIRQWYDKVNLYNFITNECIKQTQMLIPAASKIIETKINTDFEDLLAIFGNNKLESISVVKDDCYVYHDNASKIGTPVKDSFYNKSLNSNKPVVFKHSDSDNYTVIIPILNGNSRIGSIYSVWRSYSSDSNITYLRNTLSIIFAFSYLLLYLLIYFITEKINYSKLVVGNNIIQNNYDNIKSENLPQNDVFSVSVFVYFSGIEEAIQRIDERLIKESVNNCYSLARQLLPKNDKYYFCSRPDGIFITFKDESKQDSIYDALCFVNAYKANLCKYNLVFSPKITLFDSRIILLDNQELAGDCFIDYKTIAKVQTNTEIILSEGLYLLLKEVINFETLEIQSLEFGKLNVYVLGEYKTKDELLNMLNSSSEWTKLMIMRIIKDNKEFDNYENNGLIKESSE